MRVLVTGGAGFIGTHLCRALVERGDEVTVLDSLQRQVHGYKTLGSTCPWLPPEVRFIHGSVAFRHVASLLGQTDAVVHLAAVVGVGQSMYQSAFYVRRNTFETAYFFEQLVGHKPSRLVVASSMSTYGEGEYGCPHSGYEIMAPGPRPEAQLRERCWEVVCPRNPAHGALIPRPTRESKALRPTSVYAITKRDQEELALVLGAAYGIPTAALRFFNVYGPGQALTNPYTGVAAIFAAALLRGESPEIFEDGEQTRDFIHVSDVVRGVLLALDSDEVGAFNIGTGRPVSVREVFDAVRDAIDASAEVTYGFKYRAGDIRHCYADTELARRRLGFTAEIDVLSGLREYARQLRDEPTPAAVQDARVELEANGLLL